MQFERGETTSGGLSSWWEPVMKAWDPVNASFCKQGTSCGAIFGKMGFCRTSYTVWNTIPPVVLIGCHGDQGEYLCAKTCYTPMKWYCCHSGFAVESINNQNSAQGCSHWGWHDWCQWTEYSGACLESQHQLRLQNKRKRRNEVKPQAFWFIPHPSSCVLTHLQFANSKRQTKDWEGLWKIRERSGLM